MLKINRIFIFIEFLLKKLLIMIYRHKTKMGQFIYEFH